MAQNGQSQRGHHKQNGSGRCQFGQKRSGTGTSEYSLAGPAKSRADAGPTASLQEHYKNQRQTNNDMDNDNKSNHNNFI